MNKVANIAKNTSYLTLALIVQKIISFTYFTILARNLGPENLGKYYFAISFTTIFAIFIDLGLINVLTREVAKAKSSFSRGAVARDKARNLLGAVMAIKLPLTLLSWLAVFILINALEYPELTKNLVYLSSICMILDSFTMTFFATIRGFHNLKFESIGSVFFMLVAMGFGLTALYMGLSLLWVMGGLITASIFNFLFSLSALWFKWHVSVLPRFNFKLIKFISKLAIPFAAFAVFQRLYMYLDTVLLSVLAGDKYVGLYQIAFKLVFALQFLPMAFMAALYPAMSNYWHNNREQLTISFERAMNYLIIISLPIAIGITVLSDKVILLFKTGYNDAILPMQIIMLALLFIFINFPIGSLLNACDKQKINTLNMIIVTILSVIINLILIPKWQTIGASITVLITNMLMFILGIIWVPKIIKYRPWKNISVFIKSLAAGIFMGLIAYYLKEFINIFIVVVISGMLYFILLFLLKGFKKEDALSIYNSFLKKN